MYGVRDVFEILLLNAVVDGISIALSLAEGGGREGVRKRSRAEWSGVGKREKKRGLTSPTLTVCVWAAGLDVSTLVEVVDGNKDDDNDVNAGNENVWVDARGNNTTAMQWNVHKKPLLKSIVWKGRNFRPECQREFNSIPDGLMGRNSNADDLIIGKRDDYAVHTNNGSTSNKEPSPLFPFGRGPVITLQHTYVNRWDPASKCGRNWHGWNVVRAWNPNPSGEWSLFRSSNFHAGVCKLPRDRDPSV